MIPSMRPIVLLLLARLLLPAGAKASPSPLQLLIDLTPVGGRLRPPPGVYHGSFTISKTMELDGMGQVTLDGDGEGTVLRVEADSVVLRGLHLTGSGASHDGVDAALLLHADGAIVEGNVIDDVLFGIHVSDGHGNLLKENTIASRSGDPTLRGDGIRLWYSSGNRIVDNEIVQVRDIVLTNSPDNLIWGNRIHGNRMGVELIFSPRVEIAENRLDGNDHGIVGIYSDELYIHHNRIEHQPNLLGSAIAVKGSSQTRIEGNEILDCAVGLTANSPTFPEDILYLLENRFAYNDVALYFYGEKGGHVVYGNRFEGNFQQVVVSGPTSAIGNDWMGNYWQDYAGFDRDGDGFGDWPYRKFLHAERIWMDRPMTKFFRGSPVLELVDFVERLIPSSEPVMILEDPKPATERRP